MFFSEMGPERSPLALYGQEVESEAERIRTPDYQASRYLLPEIHISGFNKAVIALED